jgi:predicted regulator of Ras-like GTPase activity (Roadblock/LC7/MglB family)
MSNQAYAFALKNALTEIRNVCPDVQSSFLFDKEAAVIAGDAETPQATVEKVVKSLEPILDKADTLGGLNSLLIEGSNGSVHISSVKDMYLTMVTSKKADMRYVETVARVLIPTVMKLLDSLDSTPFRQRPSTQPLMTPMQVAKENLQEEQEENSKEIQEPTEPELPSNQLIVESFGGLLVRGDTVQISEDLMSQWEDVVEGKEIDLVEIESFHGKTSQCKVKIVDNSKLDNKAIIRIPDKLCQALDVRKGELVKVKPLIS